MYDEHSWEMVGYVVDSVFLRIRTRREASFHRSRKSRVELREKLLERYGVEVSKVVSWVPLDLTKGCDRAYLRAANKRKQFSRRKD